ncbi:MAG TPA: hypothetical protein VL175_12510, partial [Pirellulales bacterium]|nr:hypothetical protein [Pirellulales bacterium]
MGEANDRRTVFSTARRLPAWRNRLEAKIGRIGVSLSDLIHLAACEWMQSPRPLALDTELVREQ